MASAIGNALLEFVSARCRLLRAESFSGIPNAVPKSLLDAITGCAQTDDRITLFSATRGSYRQKLEQMSLVLGVGADDMGDMLQSSTHGCAFGMKRYSITLEDLTTVLRSP